MLLITGPAAAGPASCALDKFRNCQNLAPDTARLIVPTATLAEHLRNQFARDGLVVRAESIITLGKFVDDWASGLPPLPAATLELIVDRLLPSADLHEFSALRDFSGFRRSIVSAIEEFSSAGGTDADLAPAGAYSDFREILRSALDEAKRRGEHTRSARLTYAADRILREGLPPQSKLLIHGFYSFTGPELQLLEAMAATTSVTITLPVWSGSEHALERLRSLPGCEETVQPAPEIPAVEPEIVAAPSLEQEVTEIARRILMERDNGRPLREIVVIVRSEEPYVPALRAAFARFAISARFYFGSPLAGNSVVRYLSGLVRAMLRGWDFEELAATLRLKGSPLADSDLFERRVLEKLPGAGIDPLRSLASDRHSAYFDELTKLDSWREGDLPASDWVRRFRTLRRLYVAPTITDRVSHEALLQWRELAAALNAFDAALEQAAMFDPATPVSCHEFWRRMEIVLASETLRVPDHRRDVVHVIDAFEARQWKAPVVFVCGLLEKQFPKYHSEDAILPDAVRLKLRSEGVRLLTSVERQGHERFLFDVGVNCGLRRSVLSYPRLNGKGEQNLRSFFLDDTTAEQVPVDTRPRPSRPRAPEPQSGIYDPALVQHLEKTHAKIRATAVESYLQCPFQFFADSTLKLKPMPKRPADRLDLPAQGTIAHDALRAALTGDLRMDKAFEQEFAGYCRKKNVPESYRTEAVRLELLHNLECLWNSGRLRRGARSLAEVDFKLQLPDVTITGRIDRIEVDEQNRATVVDYKYQRDYRIRKTKTAHEDERRLVQGGLYLLAVAQEGAYEPAGMVYCGFKREVSFGGWVLNPSIHDFKQECQPSELAAIVNNAREDAIRVATEVRQGRTIPKPADEDRCGFCAFENACRVESIAAETITAGGSSS